MPDPPSDAADPRLAATMAYLVGFVTGALVLWRYRGDEFATFHAWQSILFSAFMTVTIVGVSTVPIAGLALAAVLLVVGAVTWMALAVQAYRGRWSMLPLIGDIALERSRPRGRRR